MTKKTIKTIKTKSLRGSMRSKSLRVRKVKSRVRVKIPIKHPGGLYGYSINMSQKSRRSLLKHILSRKKATYSQIIKRLNVLYIYNKNIHPEISKKVKGDLKFIQSHSRKYSLTFKRKIKSKFKRKIKSKIKSKSKSKIKRKSKSKIRIKSNRPG